MQIQSLLIEIVGVYSKKENRMLRLQRFKWKTEIKSEYIE